jgi:hypothetical protein
MPIPKISDRRKYAQLAMNCLSRMTKPTSDGAHDREHKKALEWIRRADQTVRPAKP